MNRFEITKGKYEGYIWMSDSTRPIILPDQQEENIVLNDCKNPFIIEGQLYADGHSVSIKYVDGHYLIKEFDVDPDDANLENVTPIEFVSHRMDGRRLRFLQYWKECLDDELCKPSANEAAMGTLRPDKMVFIGFV